eukprot:6177663-Pleurochrysis_carterae.AAC.3
MHQNWLPEELCLRNCKGRLDQSSGAQQTTKVDGARAYRVRVDAGHALRHPKVSGERLRTLR